MAAANPKGPAYKYVADQICNLIRTNEIPVGDPIPSARELESLLKATPGVMRMALRHLDNDGIIVTSQGKPAIVERLPGDPDERQTAEYRELKQLYRQLSERVDGLYQEVGMLTDEIGALAKRQSAQPRSGPEVR